MDQPKVKNEYDKNRKFINWKYKFLCIMYLLTYNVQSVPNSANTAQN